MGLRNKLLQNQKRKRNNDWRVSKGTAVATAYLGEHEDAKKIVKLYPDCLLLPGDLSKGIILQLKHCFVYA